LKTIVCGVPFTITTVDSVNFEAYGRTNGIKATIELNKNLSDEQRSATLVHEWIHAVLFCNNVTHTEEVVSILAQELYREGFKVKIKK
jgi:phage tail protein X